MVSKDGGVYATSVVVVVVEVEVTPAADGLVAEELLSLCSPVWVSSVGRSRLSARRPRRLMRMTRGGVYHIDTRGVYLTAVDRGSCCGSLISMLVRVNSVCHTRDYVPQKNYVPAVI